MKPVMTIRDFLAVVKSVPQDLEGRYRTKMAEAMSLGWGVGVYPCPTCKKPTLVYPRNPYDDKRCRSGTTCLWCDATIHWGRFGLTAGFSGPKVSPHIMRQVLGEPSPNPLPEWKTR